MKIALLDYILYFMNCQLCPKRIQSLFLFVCILWACPQQWRYVLHIQQCTAQSKSCEMQHKAILLERVVYVPCCKWFICNRVILGSDTYLKFSKNMCCCKSQWFLKIVFFWIISFLSLFRQIFSFLRAQWICTPSRQFRPTFVGYNRTQTCKFTFQIE